MRNSKYLVSHLRTHHIRNRKLHNEAPNPVAHRHQCLCYSPQSQCRNLTCQYEACCADAELVDDCPEVNEDENCPSSLLLVGDAAHNANQEQ